MSGISWGYVGGTIGLNGWLIGFVILALAAGRAELLLEYLPLAVLVTNALGLALMVAVELARRQFGERSREFRLCLFGMLGVVLGTLGMLIDRWIAPAMEGDPDMARALDATGSAMRLGDVFTGTALVVGILLLGWLAVRLMGRPSPARDG